MLSNSWLIAPAGSTAAPVKPQTKAHPRVLSTIVEVEEDESLAQVEHGSSWLSWEFSNMLSNEYASMVPQALLIDASTTLCAYLYFTSLQARMALQQQASLDILQTVCGAMVYDETSAGTMMSVCAHAVAHQQALHDSALPTFLSHTFIVLTVALKALFGYSVLKLAGKYIKPFDYLVASGAAHCLLLYCFLFVPLANVFDALSFTSQPIWQTLIFKILGVCVVGFAFGILHMIMLQCAPRSQAIALPTTQQEPLWREKAGTSA